MGPSLIVGGALVRVFMTGASGYLGTAVVADLLAAGHRVTGLVRSTSSGARLSALGADVLVGDLTDDSTLRDGAERADAVAHLAWVVPASGVDPVAVDRSAIDALGTALAGSGRRLVIASGILGLDPGHVVTEADRVSSATSPVLRGRAENGEAALALTSRDVASVLVRLPPSVHDDGRIKPGFAGRLVPIARDHGEAAYPGDGGMRWSAVHRLDAARLFRLALERAEAGSVLHAVAEEGITQRAIAETIAAGIGVRVGSLGADELARRYGWLAPLMTVDGPASSAVTRRVLDWTPTEPGLLDDLRDGVYFEDVR